MKSRNVTNDVSVRERNMNILFDVFTLNEIVKLNLDEVFILYFSQFSSSFPLCKFLLFVKFKF